MNRNVNRSYELESPYQFINPAHSFLMESVHEQHDFFRFLLRQRCRIVSFLSGYQRVGLKRAGHKTR